MINNISNNFFNSKILLDSKSAYFGLKPSVLEINLNNKIIYSIDKNSSHYRINKKINTFVLSKIPTNSCAVGFKKGLSYLDFFQPHINSQYFLRLDIKNFFHSIPEEEILSLISDIFPKNKNDKIKSPYEIAVECLTHTISESFGEKGSKERKILPIGFPTSPTISNIIFRKIDILIQKECDKKNIIYTRYADDMLFSCENDFLHKESFINEISYLVSLIGLKLNSRKTLKSRYVLSLNGYTIDTTNKQENFFSFLNSGKGYFRLSNKVLKKQIKLIHMIKENKDPADILNKCYDFDVRKFKPKYSGGVNFQIDYARDQLLNKMSGTRAYLISILKFGYKNDCLDKAYANKISKLIDDFEEILKKVR